MYVFGLRYMWTSNESWYLRVHRGSIVRRKMYTANRSQPVHVRSNRYLMDVLLHEQILSVNCILDHTTTRTINIYIMGVSLEIIQIFQWMKYYETFTTDMYITVSLILPDIDSV